MHALTRATALLAPAFGLVLLTACGTAFAPADPADAGDDGATAQDASVGADDGSGQDALVSTADAATNDANSDGSDAAPACLAPKRPNDDPCDTAADCCSNACASNHTCMDHCKSVGGICNVNAADCCVGTFCSTSIFGMCAACHPNGANAEVTALGGTVVVASCCSGHVDSTTKKCAP